MHNLFWLSVRTKLGILFCLLLLKTSYYLFSALLISCMFADETLKLLKELTSRKSLQVPNIYYHLPHLLKNEGSLQPSVQVGLGRTGGMLIWWLFHVLYLEDLLVLDTEFTSFLGRSRTSHLTCVILISFEFALNPRWKELGFSFALFCIISVTPHAVLRYTLRSIWFGWIFCK